MLALEDISWRNAAPSIVLFQGAPFIVEFRMSTSLEIELFSMGLHNLEYNSLRLVKEKLSKVVLVKSELLNVQLIKELDLKLVLLKDVYVKFTL